MDGGAELRARAISASRSIKYWSSGAMLGYGVLESAARPGREAHSTATNANVPNVIVLTISRFIDFPFQYESQLTFLHNRCGRAIRPFANRNHKLGDGLRTALKLRIQRDRRVGQIRTPRGFVCEWKIEHQMR